MSDKDDCFDFTVLTEEQAVEWLTRILKYDTDPEWCREAAEEILLKTLNNEDITKAFYYAIGWMR